MSSDIWIDLPELHTGQIQAYEVMGRFNAWRCGRRWGKTTAAVTISVDAALKGWPIGWFRSGTSIPS
jgi:hypothetical protein